MIDEAAGQRDALHLAARELDHRPLGIFAQPDQFDNMRRLFESRAREDELDFASVPLQLSFRSAPGILACVDAVFADAWVALARVV